MRDSQKNREFLQDIAASLIAIAIAAAVAFLIHYFFPGAWWIWLVFAAYATLTLAADFLNLGLWKLTNVVVRDNDGWAKARQAAAKKTGSESDSDSHESGH